MIDYSLILVTHYSGKQWSLNGDTYEGLDWLDETPKPTQEQLDELWLSTQEYVAKQLCKQQAQELLLQTDWTVTADVGDPSSTPYLVNQSAFKAYRNSVRALAVHPIANAVFPEQPVEQWSI